MHKVCAPIHGRPAILRAIDCYRRFGLDPIVAVVGSRAQNVMDTVTTAFPQVLFAFQPRRLGTGNAVRYGFEKLEQTVSGSGDTPVLITMGDKVVSPRALGQLIDAFYCENPALAFCTAPRSKWASGRVARDERGEPIGIFEVQDIRRAAFVGRLLDLCHGENPVPVSEIGKLIEQMDLSRAKVKLLLGDFLDLVLGENDAIEPEVIREFFPVSQREVVSGDRSFDPGFIESASPQLNVSLYLIRSRDLALGLKDLKPGNAQGEEYITDLVNQLIFRYRQTRDPACRVVEVPLDDERLVMSYNDREQLSQIETLLEKLEKHD